MEAIHSMPPTIYKLFYLVHHALMTKPSFFVIITYRKSDFANVHFDLQQCKNIIWENEDDLYKKLKTRIAGTIIKLYEVIES